MFLPLGNFDKGIFCIVVALTTNISPNYSHLRDEDIKQYADRVSSQIEVLIETETKNRESLIQNHFIRSFFDSQLDQTKTLTNCLDAILRALPNWERGKGSHSETLIQLLAYHGRNQPLTIQAQLQAARAVKKELIARDVGKPVLIADSVCGTLVQDFAVDPTRRIRNVDPSIDPYRSLYKAFLGQEIPRSELMAVIAEGNELIGILNLEHPDRHHFSPACERIVSTAAASLAPFVRELNVTLEQDRKRQSEMLYMMFGLLNRLSHTYQHKVSQLTPQIFKPWRALKELIDAENTEAHRQLDMLGDKMEAYIDSTKVFVKGAPYYLSRGPVDLKVVVDGAIKEVRDPSEKISYQFNCVGKPIVYASPMFQEYVFNLLKNARDAICDRLGKRGASAGAVEIDAVREKTTDNRGRETSGERVHIATKDNGTGVKEEDLQKIGDYNYTTKGKAGTGYGLPEARDYVRSLGGEFEYRNRLDGDGFIVEMFLDVFDKDRHIDETVKGKAE